ncbi:MAG: hydantoinase/oxoprolinase family protein, partial [Desulfovibrionaceae bacterium]|nr:hydantoinase/oxoprolinase family protein [Desulfovibrionaceae bacterium]
KLNQVSQVSLGTTLAVNALVQGKTDPVGLLLTAGPGLSPKRFVLDKNYAIIRGGVDHRGVEVSKLNCKEVPDILKSWSNAGIKSVACVGKFSPRATEHETTLGKFCEEAGLNYTLGHRLSGELNFPRRIATAYYNAAVQRIQNKFLDAVEETLKAFEIKAAIRLLNADGGAIPIELARKQPVQSILSGPAASVLGIMALNSQVEQGVSLLLDIGGTTTDLAVIVDGSPVLDRDGMLINDRRTLVRALASISIGVGGDSKISVKKENKDLTVTVGPERLGPAMAFGGDNPTLLDALNTLGLEPSGEIDKSLAGIDQLAKTYNLSSQELAKLALQNALQKIHLACETLLKQINAKPIYTLAQLRSYTLVKPERIMLVGGPANSLKTELEKEMQLPVIVPQEFSVANAIGACLTRATESLEVYADTGKAKLQAPKLGYTEDISNRITQKEVETRALELLKAYMEAQGSSDCPCEVLESNLFATLNDYGRSSKDIRVTCQAVPGILARPTHANCAV